MNQIRKLAQLEELSYFDKNTLSQVVDVSDKALYENIQRWIRNDSIVPLKKGLYVTRKYIDNVNNPARYAEFIANILRTPSYLSVEYVLQKHSVLTESVFAYTSITRKTKRTYQNSLGRFTYRSIKPELANGFELTKLPEYDILEASKEKALFDYLYLKLFRSSEVTERLIDSFRLNLDGFTLEEKQKFGEYCDLTKTKKYIALPKIVFV